MPRATIDDLLEQARARLRRLEPAQASAAASAGAVLVDLRESEHIRRDGAIPGALTFARNVLEWRLDPECPWRDPQAPGLDAHVVLFCDHGFQSSLAAATLQDMGFKKATDLVGGFEAWKAEGLPVEDAD